MHRLPLSAIAAAALLLAAPRRPAPPRRRSRARASRSAPKARCARRKASCSGPARATLFDRKWALICADVDRPIGAAFSWKGASDVGAAARPRPRRRARVRRPGRGPTQRPARSSAAAARQGSGLAWHSYAAPSGGWVHVVEGFAAFDGALRLTLASLVENRVVPGTLDVVTTGGSGSLAAGARRRSAASS